MIVLLKEHIQKNSLLLDKGQIEGLKEAHRNAEGPELKAQLALVLSSLPSVRRQRVIVSTI